MAEAGPSATGEDPDEIDNEDVDVLSPLQIESGAAATGATVQRSVERRHWRRRQRCELTCVLCCSSCLRANDDYWFYHAACTSRAHTAIIILFFVLCELHERSQAASSLRSVSP